MSIASITNALEWRYAVKEFDSGKKLTREQIDLLLESLRLCASSWGLQPWGFVVVTNPGLRQQLLGHSWGQRQVVDASHLIVLCRRKSFTSEDVDTFAGETARLRGQDPASLEGYRKMVKGFIAALDDASLAAWMKDQVYLALGSLLTVCAIEAIDACPMEGFVPAEFDRILGLEAMGLKSVVLCPVGYRKESDKYASLRKVRYPVEKVVTYIE